MVTRDELRGYRTAKKELEQIRSLAKQAEQAAKLSKDERERRRSEALAKRYEKVAGEREREILRIEKSIESLDNPRHRSVLLCRFIRGYGRVRTAMTLGISERTVSYATKEALAKLESGDG